ncbi:DEAD/DEAH box helicase [Brumimicrobium salinarum]|uniref:DEAD/DEAH box helicase n=1 Tax=Brumimicrobium salinarum TaxID=2058658 RepID=A0A2I0R288_9FLAO|nr:DEAD/DEAH box helicase [Brumimicrobium salinarum]PKR80510.1 DEAD/DEAH box helicase [Brumimicrobium salinarum]
MKFEDIKLNKQLLSALQQQGITEMTPIQEKAIPKVLSGTDVIGIAQTGTGKTLAYLLPLLRDLKYAKTNQPRVLILVPTRELAVQVATEVEKLTEFLSLRSLAVYGGTNINTQKKAVHEGCDIIVGTPGRLYDIAMTGLLRLKDIKKVVIDECDEMLSLGFRPQIQRIFDLLPEKRQNLLFSATITDEVETLVSTFFRKTEKIIAAPSGTPLQKINQTAYLADNFNTKYNLLKHLLEQDEVIKKAFIFVQSRVYADILSEKINIDFPDQFGVVHSNKSQNYRLRMVKEFKKDELRGIIATDLVARGIDIDNVSHVINFDLPDNKENYIHRIGRTARAEAEGNTISFIKNSEKNNFEAIQDFMKVSIEFSAFPENVNQTEELIPLEQTPDINEAPTVLNPKHSIGSGPKDEHKKKEFKRNIRPIEKKLERKKQRKNKRKK